jgi:ferric-dicitrate binding protein FerR (iron transport regulator)
MNTMEKENKTYLADWLAGNISDEQLRQLVGETEFLAFQKLKNALEGHTVSDPDLEQNFSAIKQKFETQKTARPVKVISLWRYAAVAASVLVFFGLFQLFYFSNANETTFGATQILTLPDNSRVTLNAKSKLSYPNLFQYNRTLDLEGEAFFEVQKGSTFTVKTALGCVKVLGTKFNVNAHDDYFEVMCYEGKVKVESMGKIAILTPTECIRFYDHTSENWAESTQPKPSWITGESAFRNVPMQYVFNQFRNQFNVTIDYPESVKNVRFTGAFTHKNKITALKSICIPLHLNYADDGSGKIKISE